MLRPVVSHQSLRHLVPRALHPTMTELRQCDGIALAREDGIENRLATGSGDVAEHMVELQVQLTERLLQAQIASGGRKLARSNPTECRYWIHWQSDTSLLRPGTLFK